MTATILDTESWPQPVGGWPPWVANTPYAAAAHPQQRPRRPIATGANCQRYAYAVLALFDRQIPDHRSSDLWEDPDLAHPALDDADDLDLVLFNSSNSAWGAHVAVLISGELLHLCAEVGRPADWTWQQFAERSRYNKIIGVVRSPAMRLRDS